MGLRRTARECALQMLYEFDVGGNTRSEILQTFWQMNEHPEKVVHFANELFEGTIQRLEEIDAIIQQHTKNWRLGRMAVVDRNILRLAVFEFLSGNQTPQTVVINEERAAHWLRQGAQPSETTARLLKKAGILDKSAPAKEKA